MDCPFCSKNIKELVLIESERAILIVNLFPAVFGHLLVIPRDHICSLSALPPPTSGDMFALAVRAANILRGSLSPHGMNIFLNEGKIAGQNLEHLHLHVVPRTPSDNLVNFRRKSGGERTEIPTNWRRHLKALFSK